MHTFTRQLVKGVDASRDLPILGFEIRDMFIFDPARSECGRFAVDPVATYGVSLDDARELARLNDVLESATQAAIDSACHAVQSALGVDTGDFAGLHFSGDETGKVADVVADYLLAQYQQQFDQEIPQDRDDVPQRVAHPRG